MLSMTFNNQGMSCKNTAFARPLLLSALVTHCLLSFISGMPIIASAAPRPPWTSNRVVGSPNPPAPYAIERLFPKLNFKNPVDLGLLPGSDRFFLLEQAGQLYSFPAKDGVESPELVFDFHKHHEPFDASYAFAFHPRFSQNHFIFVCYVEPGGRTNGSFVSRFTLKDVSPPVIDPASERVIIRWLSGGHNGCTLAFGKDGFLYISTGDAANPDPPDTPFNTGQDISDLLSSILRIDVDRSEGTNNYAIPSDNPFVKTPGARPEVYAFGLRNPWRMSIDSLTGDLWVGDVGWEQWEMIYRVKRGGNYGWSIVEGPNKRVRTDVKPGPGPILPPLVALPHSDAASITGGRIYRGKKLPKLRGAYLYGDWETGKFWALRSEGDRLLSNDELCDTTLKPVSFAEDPDGELLILDYSGGIYQFTPSAAPPANLVFPRNLSESGLFADVASLKPAPGVVPYRINAEMWSDFATVERWVGVPGSDTIVTTGGRETIAGRMWYFPSNTVFARTLVLETQRGVPSTQRRIETQLMHFEGQTWNAYTYRWNTAQTDAELVPAQGANDSFIVTDAAAPGGKREIPWRFAGRAECLRCHNAWAGETLSFGWMQLAGDETARQAGRQAATEGRDTQIGKEFSLGKKMRALEDLGVLTIKDVPPSVMPLASPYDPHLALTNRARSWLHVNCSPCHRNGAGGDVPSWFNYDQPLEKTRAYDAKPVRGDFGMLAARVIAPADPDRSTLIYRISTEGSGRMPHIGSRLVDEAGVRLMRDWIRALPADENEKAELGAARQLSHQNAEFLSHLQGPGSRMAVTNLLASTSGALALLDHLVSATNGGARASSPNDDIRQNAAAVASVHTNALVRDLFQRLLPPDQRRQTLGADFDPQTVLVLRGNSARGRELFQGVSQCARCHVCDGAGRAFGPELSGISRKYNRVQLLEQILFPSKIIAPEHKTQFLTLRDETELTGLIVKRTPTDLVLRDETLNERTVKLADIKETREATISAMPEGLLAPLTAQEAANLLEFIFASKPSAAPPP